MCIRTSFSLTYVTKITIINCTLSDTKIYSMNRVRYEQARESGNNKSWTVSNVQNINKHKHVFKLGTLLLKSGRDPTFASQLPENSKETTMRVCRTDLSENAKNVNHVPPFSGTCLLTASIADIICFRRLNTSSISLWPFPAIYIYFISSFNDIRRCGLFPGDFSVNRSNVMEIVAYFCVEYSLAKGSLISISLTLILMRSSILFRGRGAPVVVYVVLL
jgi:hypothetical protein